MRIKLNDSWVNIPSSLGEITLKQRIDFQVQHGDELDKMAKSILAMPEGWERELEMTQFQFEKMYRSFSFFAGCSVEAVKESKFIDEIANIYYSSLRFLLEHEDKLEPEQEFVWKGEVWVLQAPELKYGDKMTFGELIDSKQIVQDMIKLGQSHWECLLPLCTIYLRKRDEVYNEVWVQEGSERLQLMETLPLDIALQVGFFLSSSLNLFINTSLSSNPQGLKTLERTLKSTLNSSGG